jgi:hypothetical protein
MHDAQLRSKQEPAPPASLMSCYAHAQRNKCIACTIDAADPNQGSFADLSKYGDSKKCEMACAGDPKTSCGDECTVDLYISDSVPTELVLPKSGLENLGCWRWVLQALGAAHWSASSNTF